MLNRQLIRKVETLNLKFPVATIAKNLEFSKGTVSSYLKGNTKASRNFLIKFADHYKINISELIEKETKKDSLLNNYSINEVVKEIIFNESDFLKNKTFNNWLELKLTKRENEIHKKYLERDRKK